MSSFIYLIFLLSGACISPTLTNMAWCMLTFLIYIYKSKFPYLIWTFCEDQKYLIR